MEITQDHINNFAKATGDEQWIPINTERAARKSPGGKTIAHELLSLSPESQGCRKALIEI